MVLCFSGSACPFSGRGKGGNLVEGSVGSRAKQIPDALSQQTKDALFVSAPSHRRRHRVRNCLMLELQLFNVRITGFWRVSGKPICLFPCPLRTQQRRHVPSSRLSPKFSLGLSSEMSPAHESPSGYSLSSLGIGSPLRPASKLLAASKDMVLRVL